MTIHTLIHDWQSITIDLDSQFSQALEVINEGGYQLCLVRNSTGSLLGMVTDSDIRKALLKGIDLDASVEKIMNKSPLIVSPDLGENEAHQLMLVNHFFHLPVVNDQGHLVGLHVAEQLQSISQRNETLVIMAGGRGKRLIPLTDTCPKPMLPINGKPILEHLIDRAKADGFSKIVISVNYLSDQIINHFQDGSRFDVQINYIHENKPLGTAGSLSLLSKETVKHPIIVTNGDVLTNVSYSDLLSSLYSNESDGIMAIRLQEWQNPFGVVHSEGTRLIGLEEKPTYRHQVNAGIYALKPKLISLIKRNSYCDMTDLFSLGIEKKLNLNVFPLHESWLDIGRHSDYKIAQEKVN
ncbi:nucleotidyltransferase family protein [Synechococcus sp. YX-04-1]|uniref:nucleotidyltransferase family protein n=1 Tax=Synechococcus sp. YX-04-1 TaxID=3062778 RepID=UPI0026E424B8|nr:nucleotidyltransferase family protein [Synechococcus sp. YX-04-1]MDO6351111.1 nucleotidyltransferase family protein [Synechococcus sp. YX-04-1]